MSGVPADTPCLHPSVNGACRHHGRLARAQDSYSCKMLEELLPTINSYPCRMVAGVHPDVFHGGKKIEHVKEKLPSTRGWWVRSSGQWELAPSD